MTYVAEICQIGLYIILQLYADINQSGYNRLEWLEILEMLWSVIRLIIKTSSVIPVFYVFNLITIIFLPAVKVLNICTWEVLGANVLKAAKFNQ